jgi:hypothetical protein
MDGTLRSRLLRVSAELDELLAAASIDTVSDSSLLNAIDRIGAARRLVDALGTAVSGEIAKRSAPGDEESLARRLGAKNPSHLVALRARLDPATATSWTTVGALTATRRSILGEKLPPAHPEVAAGLDLGDIDSASGRVIIATVDACSIAADQANLLEETLVRQAPSLTPRELTRLCREVIARYAPETGEEREAALRARSGLRIVQRPDGLTHIAIDTHPEAAGLILASIDARTAPRRIPRFATEGSEPVEDHDRRTLAQRRLDALVDVARDSVARDDGQLAGTSVSMVVTVPLETLVSGRGTASIAGIDEPISAATARRLAAVAEIIPAVLGTDSEVLDLGRSARLFSSAQRRAIALRDRGCAWGGCDAPPGWCEVAHIDAWYLGGRTDLCNGVLLCRFHHQLFDSGGWRLEWRDGVPWFIPPRWVDSSQTPRRGGRPRLAA